MLDKNKIENSVVDHLSGTNKFLVDIEVSPSNIVDVYVDADQGISIGACAEISRFIESQFDRDNEDYELRVSSPGLDRPFKLRRQYKKYIGKGIRVELNDGKKINCSLLSMNDDELEIEIKSGKKSKEKVKQIIHFDNIKSAKPEISFK